MFKRFWLIAVILIVACQPTLSPTPTRTPPQVANDAFALYAQALTPSAQNDLSLIDRPTRYNLTLRYEANPPTLTGKQEVIYFNTESQPLNEIYFRLFANYPDSGGKITVTQTLVEGKAVTPELQAQNTALRIPLATSLAPNDSLTVQLDFTVTIPRNSQTHYADFTASDTVVTLPTIYPLIPAYDAQGWHIELPPPYGDLVYADVSFYRVAITVPANMLVIASGSTFDVVTHNDGTTTWHIVGAPMRDFDINLTTQLQKASIVIGETTINSYFELADAEGGKKALHVAKNALEAFQQFFGPYPYRELDIVQTPTTAGGIEYPGVVVIGKKLYSDPKSADFFEFATAHEVAHQWWYAMVGNDQVNYPWVDEALAQYSTLMYYESAHGSASASNILRNAFQAPYNRAKNEGRDQAVNQPVSAFTENDYGTIVYGKAPLFYDALRKKLGEEKFSRFLKTYFARYKYKIAFPDNILKTAEEVCGCSLQAEYQQWILSPAK
jgi:hypothetical protein